MWYVRRSRNRFKENSADKKQAEEVLRHVLLEFSKSIAPILPFTSEFVFNKIGEKESVHLAEFPRANKKLIDKNLEKEMSQAREIVNLALAERMAKGIKVKQPLSTLKVGPVFKIANLSSTMTVIKDEINVKEIVQDNNISGEVELDTNLTEELKAEGFIRELIREVQAQRKEQNLIPQDRIIVDIFAPVTEKTIIEKNKEFLLKELRANEISIKNQEEEKRLIKITRAN